MDRNVTSATYVCLWLTTEKKKLLAPCLPFMLFLPNTKRNIYCAMWEAVASRSVLSFLESFTAVIYIYIHFYFIFVVLIFIKIGYGNNFVTCPRKCCTYFLWNKYWNKETVALDRRLGPLPFLVSYICLTKLATKSKESKNAVVCSILRENNWWG